MSYADYFSRYGNQMNEGQIIIREYIRRPEAVTDAESIKLYDRSAATCRYKHMAATVVGPERYIYSSDYAQEMLGLFVSDTTQL